MLVKNKQAFANNIEDLPGYSGTCEPFKIELEQQPKVTGRRRHHPEQLDLLKKTVAEFDAVGITEVSSNTKYCSEATFPRKKDSDGRWTQTRVCFDFRATNDKTPFTPYNLPRGDELMDKFGKAKIFTKLDLKSGFYQVNLPEQYRNMTTFRVGKEFRRFTRMPFGLKNAPIYFQRMMNHEIQRHGLEAFVACYVDDIVIFQ